MDCWDCHIQREPTNENTLDDLKVLLGQIQRINPRLLTAIDEEGGRVQRTQDFDDFTPLESAHDLGKLYESNKTKGRDNIIKNTEVVEKTTSKLILILPLALIFMMMHLQLLVS